MSNFLRIVTDAISDLKKSPEYEPGKEVSILVPMKSKSGSLKGVPLDDAKLKYLEGNDLIVRGERGKILCDMSHDGFVACRVTGRIR